MYTVKTEEATMLMPGGCWRPSLRGRRHQRWRDLVGAFVKDLRPLGCHVTIVKGLIGLDYDGEEFHLLWMLCWGFGTCDLVNG